MRQFGTILMFAGGIMFAYSFFAFRIRVNDEDKEAFGRILGLLNKFMRLFSALIFVIGIALFIIFSTTGG